MTRANNGDDLMKIRSKMAMAATVALMTGAAALTSGASSASAWGWKHFHRGPFVANCYGNRPHHICFGHVRGWRHNHGYRGYGFIGGCGWRWVTVKRWNASHTKLLIVRDRVRICY